MSDATSSYWQECVSDAVDECGLTLSPEQLRHLAKCIEGAHDNYGMAFHHPESPYPSEIKRLKEELYAEREKVVCPECRGKGRMIENFLGRSSDSQCSKCHGEGKVKP